VWPLDKEEKDRERGKIGQKSKRFFVCSPISSFKLLHLFININNCNSDETYGSICSEYSSKQR
jgi:hypothetical protein